MPMTSPFQIARMLWVTSVTPKNWSESAPNDVTLTLSRPSLRGNWAFHAPRALERVKDRLRPLRDRHRQAADGTQPPAQDGGTP